MEENKKVISRIIQNKPFNGNVEIIIPFYGAHAHVSKLLQNIFNTVYSNKYLVTLVDDSSKNSSYYEQINEAIKKSKLPGVRIFRRDKNEGFGSSINFALRNPFVFKEESYQEIPYVVVLHSDVSLVHRDWLFNLGSCLERMKSKNVKMISPLTNNPLEGTLRLESKNRNSVFEDMILNEEEYLPLYCAIFHRDLFKYVAFPERSSKFSTEAKELAVSMRSKGLHQGICGSSWVYHEGRVTTEKFERIRDKNKNVAKDRL